MVDADGITVSALADRLVIRSSTMSKMIDRLVAKNLVKRVSDIRDGRRILVLITPAGAEAKRVIYETRGKLDSELFHALSKKNSSEILDSLKQWREHKAAQLQRYR